MTRPNTHFELSVEDIELIETALLERKASLIGEVADIGDACPVTTEQVRGIHELLGRLHNQKQFFRPKSDVYVSG